MVGVAGIEEINFTKLNFEKQSQNLNEISNGKLVNFSEIWWDFANLSGAQIGEGIYNKLLKL